MTQWGLQILDLTYPITSMFSGRQFNQTIRGTFGDVQIEDLCEYLTFTKQIEILLMQNFLGIPYFTVTTDLTASCARIHTHGNILKSLLDRFLDKFISFPLF